MVFPAMILASDYRARQPGFTLVELVMAMVIAGIIAVVAVPRFFDSDAFQERGAAEQAKAALRYGQKIAIAQRRNISVQISGGATLDCGIQLAGGNVNCVIPDRVGVTPALPRTVTFNALGQPVPNIADSLTVGTTTIFIEAETGYVHSP